jgi:hypothetical protein
MIFRVNMQIVLVSNAIAAAAPDGSFRRSKPCGRYSAAGRPAAREVSSYRAWRYGRDRMIAGQFRYWHPFGPDRFGWPCPFLGAKPTSCLRARTSEFDPERASRFSWQPGARNLGWYPRGMSDLKSLRANARRYRELKGKEITWPLPFASPSAAVRCAVEIQEGLFNAGAP